MCYQQVPLKMQHQRGMVLIVALIILLVLTILGVSGMSTSSLQERMAANAHDRQIAFQAAESGLRAGENYIQNNNMQPSMFSTTCTNGLCDCSSKTNGCAVYWQDKSIWSTSNLHVTLSTTNLGQNVAAPPMYIIEFLGYVNPPGTPSSVTPGPTVPGVSEMFRITAIGTGQSPNATVMLQSTYKK